MAKNVLRHRTPETSLRPHHVAILAYIDAHGYITDSEYARLTERAKATHTLDFNQLIGLGLIVRLGRGSSTHYRQAEAI